MRVRKYGPILVRAFTAAKLPAVWGLAFARQESDFRPDAQALTGGDAKRGGSYGLCAMTLQTAREYQPTITVDDLKDPELNATAAAAHIAALVRQCGPVLHEVAARYNSGKSLERAPDSTRDVYVPNVVKFSQQYVDLAHAMEDSQHAG